MKVRVILDNSEHIIMCREVYYKRDYLILIPMTLDDKVKIKVDKNMQQIVLDKLYNDDKVDCREFTASLATLGDY